MSAALRIERPSFRRVPHATMRPLLVLLLVIAPCFGHAQDTLPPVVEEHRLFGRPYYPNVQDSADFTQFWKDLRFAKGTWPSDTVANTYRLRWIVDEHGGSSSISRGDSGILHHEPGTPWDFFLSQPFQLADGRRGLQLAHEIPCGLICRTTWYYVED